MAFNNFCWVSYFFDFVIDFKFFEILKNISVDSFGLFLFYVVTYAKGFFVVIFWGFVVLLTVFFLIIRIPYLLV